jgi:hypothetical protein
MGPLDPPSVSVEAVEVPVASVDPPVFPVMSESLTSFRGGSSSRSVRPHPVAIAHATTPHSANQRIIWIQS